MRFIVLLLLAGCVPKALPTAYVPTFAYNPTPGSAGAGISLALVNPELNPALQQAVLAMVAKQGRTVTDPRQALSPSYTKMLDTMSSGLLAYLTGQGITVSGPFSSIDTMTFPEKKQADLVVTVEVNIVTGVPPVRVLQTSQYLPPKAYASGPCFVDGDISFVMWEPLSSQRMWTKKVDVTRVEEDCSWSGNVAEFDLHANDATSRLEEKVFAEVMAGMERYFTADEIALVKSQAAELREKKVY